MEKYSILFHEPIDYEKLDDLLMPGFFADIQLKPILRQILDGWQEYQLNEFFYYGLDQQAAIDYRLDIFRAFEDGRLVDGFKRFTQSMRSVIGYLKHSRTLHHPLQRQKWHLDAAMLYIDTLFTLKEMLAGFSFKAHGLQKLSHWLDGYMHHEEFQTFSADASLLCKRLEAIRYSIQLESDRVLVDEDAMDADYCAELYEDFKDFAEDGFSYEISFFSDLELSVLESEILQKVQASHQKDFQQLQQFCLRHPDFLDDTLLRLEREVQFYLAYKQYMERMREKGFCFCYPFIGDSVDIQQGYDLALADTLQSPAHMICNSLTLSPDERICMITGPNQGGKTTFVRMLGQIAFLASIGCPVPAQYVHIPLIDGIFSLFSQQETWINHEGRLRDELLRTRAILDEAGARSLIVINELFASTTTEDAKMLGQQILTRVRQQGCFCVYVTHIYELADVIEGMVSLVALLQPCYHIVRQPADGQVNAYAIMHRHHLSYESIKERIGR